MKQITRVFAAVMMASLIADAGPNTRAQEPTRTIEIHAKRFAFVPSEITLKPGETITLHLISDDVTHSLLIPGLKINQAITKDHPVDVKVTPSAVGDFRGKCGHFCGSGHGSMVFTVHVKE